MTTEIIVICGMFAAFILGFVASSILSSRKLASARNDTWRQARIFFTRKQREEM